MRVTWNGPQVKARARAGAAQGLRQAAEHVLAESRQIVPIEEGTLSRSGTTSVDEGQMVAAVSYDTPYAARQHEDLSLRHDQGRTGKYLERPLVGTRTSQARIIADAVRRELGT